MSRAYFDLINPQYISWEFYSQYLDKEPPFGELGAIVYLRTYSRFVAELKRREIWQETILRNIEYSLSLDKVSSIENKKQEAENLFDMMFNLRGFPAGRSLWTAGSEQTLKDASSNWNCTGKVVDSLTSFSEIFYWLLIGAGTGFSVEKIYTNQLPEFNPNVTLVHEEYSWRKRLDGTFINLANSENTDQFKNTYTDFIETTDIIKPDEDFVNSLNNDYKILRMEIGDSKEDWCNALRILLKALTNFTVEKIIINYDPIRPEGTPIKTFGGRASGHKALLVMFNNIVKVIKRCSGVLDSVGVLDIVNSIGLNVVSGGVRRTAQIALGDSFDTNFKTAKVGLFTDPNKAEYQSIRTMSNNSTNEYENPGLDSIRHTFDCLKDQGDPGFWIVGNAQKRAVSPIKLTNPCAEAGLDDRQSCNLTTTNVFAHITKCEKTGAYILDWDRLKQSIELVARLGSRITLADQWHPEWDGVQKRDRLLGVSMTGVVDAFDLLEWDYEQQKYFFRWCKEVAIKAADDYHDFLGINRSARICLMKPEGTISQLPTVSSGIHRAYAPYYLRRVRFSKTDPLAKVLLNLGLQPIPENGQGADLFGDICNTWVFTFPIKTNAKIRAIDESAIAQLERYRLAQSNYADRGHNISVTVTLAPQEYEKAAQWVHDNWDDIIGIAFLPRFDPVEGGKASYPLMPYEPCDRETYETLKAQLPILSQSDIIDKLSEIEKGFEEQELEKGCSTGACPIR
jgi:adenosylcobalamin-dependent ribonucleoside-triphosphate reductase